MGQESLLKVVGKNQKREEKYGYSLTRWAEAEAGVIL
jgi:hypothetical protein